MKRLAILLGGAALALAACSAQAAEVRSTDFELPPEVEVVFQVLTPEGTAGGAGVMLAVLDPITGLEINPQYHEMEAEGERSYSLRLSVPMGSQLIYRYVRAGAGLVREAAAEGNFLYRVYLVDGPGHVVTDLVAAWQDQASEPATGGISGIIQDAESGEPLPNVRVAVSGVHTQSNAAGEFTITGLLQGLHTLVAYDENGAYKTFQQGALVAAGLETPANIQLRANELVRVQFTVNPPQSSVPGVPITMWGNLSGLRGLMPDGQDDEGRYLFSAEVPVGGDIRYKYSQGDGFWNAEHLANGDYLLRQIILEDGIDGLTVNDEIATWEAGNSAPIWFELAAPEGTAQAFIQFKFIDWTPAIGMWPLGGGNFAYKLSSPTNFAAPLEYRYCLDSFCLNPEDSAEARSVIGNLDNVQYIEDQVSAWK